MEPLQTMAGCEPSNALRDRIANDLNIKGEVSFPQRIDMRALIPVYNFQSSPPYQKFLKYSNSINLGGTTGYSFRIFDMTDVNPRRDYGIIEKFWLRAYVDAAGRAALAAAGTEIAFALRTRLNGAVSTPYWLACEGSYPAAAGFPGIHIFSNISTVTYRGGAPTPDEYIELDAKIQPMSEINLATDEGVACEVYLSTLGNFPANSQLQVFSSVRVYGISGGTLVNSTPLT